MSNWKQKIEAQIARERYTGKVELTLDQANALLDVAVAAENYTWSLKHGKTTEAMNCYCDGLKDSLDKLREIE